MALFPVPLAVSPISGAFAVPPSKSLHQRALALAVLAEGTTVIDADGDPAGDVARLAEALGLLAGRPVRPTGPVEGAFRAGGLGASRDSLRLDLGMNATGLRIATVLAGLRPLGARTLLSGRPRLLARPHGPLLRALEALGGHAHRRASGSIRVIACALSPRPVAMRGEASSQFATALALAAPRMGGLDLTLVGQGVSAPYLDMTLDMLRAFGVSARRLGNRIVVEAATPRAARVRVEPDASSAAAWWAAAALSGGEASVPGLAADSSQPDAALLAILSRMGATVGRTASGEALVTGPRGRLVAAGDVDLRDAPDLAPLVAALAAGAEGETRVVGAAHLAWKESDRIASSVAAVRALGGDAEPREDGFVVRGRRLAGGTIDVRGDHRLVLAFGVLGLTVAGITLRGAGAVEKSYPGFTERLTEAAGG